MTGIDIKKTQEVMIMEVTTVRQRGRLTLPVKIREKLGLREGDQLAIESGDRYIVLRPLEVPERRHEDGLLSEDHPFWKLVGIGRSGHRDVSSNKYKHLSEVYHSDR